MSNLNLNSHSKNILILMTGSIAAYKVCHLISQLKQQGHLVRVAMTAAAAQFVGPTTIEGLTGEAPHIDMYEKDQVMSHIHWARWADLILVAPATANTINKMAYGIADDLVSTLYLAHDFTKPFLITPAMNTKMYQHPTTQASLTLLKKHGCEILETASGVLACGEVGFGRLLEPELILYEINLRLAKIEKRSTESTVATVQNRKRILITSGGTQEPLDDVRVITNKSTGSTAAYLADYLIEAGCDITYVHAANAKKPILNCHLVSYVTFNDLDQALTDQLKKSFDVVIHAAAVSDYSVIPQQGKMNSDVENLEIRLKKNPKLIEKIKKLSPQCQLMGFKLTSTTDSNVIHDKVNSLFTKAGCDFVIHNDWSTIQSGQHRFTIYERNKSSGLIDLNELAFNLNQIIYKKENKS